MKRLNDITGIIVEKAIEVHRHLGPGLLESTYQACLAYELRQSDLIIEVQKPLPVIYKEVKLECGYRIDILADERVVVEIKSVNAIAPIHLAQILTYMRLQNFNIGLLLNFNVTLMKNGIKRVVNDFQE